MTKRQMRLGPSMRYLDYHDAAWRRLEVPAGGSSDYGYSFRCAQRTVEGMFDMVFFAYGAGVRANDDPPGSLSHSNLNVELEPLTLLSALATMTRRIGLVSTASTTYDEPYHVAHKFASLDHISGGRAGWNIVTPWSEQEAWNFSRDTDLPGGIDDFVELLAPELQRRGRFRRENEGATLRENLGLPPASSRWTQSEALARAGD